MSKKLLHLQRTKDARLVRIGWSIIFLKHERHLLFWHWCLHYRSHERVQTLYRLAWTERVVLATTLLPSCLVLPCSPVWPFSHIGSWVGDIDYRANCSLCLVVCLALSAVIFALYLLLYISNICLYISWTNSIGFDCSAILLVFASLK